MVVFFSSAKKRMQIVLNGKTRIQANEPLVLCKRSAYSSGCTDALACFVGLRLRNKNRCEIQRECPMGWFTGHSLHYLFFCTRVVGNF